MTNTQSLPPFTALATIYEQAGFSEASTTLASHILDIAYELEWTGRTVLDLGTGTGPVANWFAGRRFRAFGVDTAEPMLAYGRAYAEQAGIDSTFIVGDIRTYQPEIPFDLVTCIGTLNYMTNLEEVGAVFKVAAAALPPTKLFFFDLRTIYGLAHSPEGMIADNGITYAVYAKQDFSYETLALTTQYTLYFTQRGTWQRAEEMHLRRGYPVQAILRRLTAAGFRTERIVGPDLETAEGKDDLPQILFVARRV
jgi:SAM-dependent methyltransferase